MSRHVTYANLPTMTHCEVRRTLTMLEDAFGANTFTTRDASECGVSTDRLASAVRAGALIRLARGLYSLAPGPLDAARSVVERLRSIGIPSAVGECTVGVCWGVAAIGARSPLPEAPATVMVPREACDQVGVRLGSRSGVRMVAADLAPQDVMDWDGLPVTTPLRTGLDIARRHGRSRASALVPLCSGARMEIAVRSGLVPLESLHVRPIAQEITERARASDVRRSVLADLREMAHRVSAHGMRWTWPVLPDVEPLVETALEGLAWAHLTGSSLPRPRPQEWVRGASGRKYRADFLIGDRVILECDGAVKYSEQTPWQEKQRQSDLEAAGYWVVRCTWEELIHRPHEVIKRIARALIRAG